MNKWEYRKRIASIFRVQEDTEREFLKPLTFVTKLLNIYFQYISNEKVKFELSGKYKKRICVNDYYGIILNIKAHIDIEELEFFLQRFHMISMCQDKKESILDVCLNEKVGFFLHFITQKQISKIQQGDLFYEFMRDILEIYFQDLKGHENIQVGLDKRNNKDYSIIIENHKEVIIQEEVIDFLQRLNVFEGIKWSILLPKE